VRLAEGVERKATHLLGRRLDDLMAAIPDGYAEETGHPVDVCLPQLIDNDAAFPFPNHHGRLLVEAAVLEQGMPEVLPVGGEQMFRGSRFPCHGWSNSKAVKQA
jgi:hypothetical protein